MININLLDWRSKAKNINNNIFFVVAGAAAFVSVIVSSIFVILFVQLSGNKQGNIGYLNTQIQEVEKKITKIKGLQEQKELLLSRRKIIEELQDSRTLQVRVFDGLAKSMPDGVMLTSLTRVGDDLTLVGDSYSNSDISVLMKQMQQLKWVKSVELNEIKAAVVSQKDDGAGGAKLANDNSVNKINFEIKVTIDPKLAGGVNETK